MRLLSVAVLYAFLMVVLYTIWRDLRAGIRGRAENHGEFPVAAGTPVPLGRLRVLERGSHPSQSDEIFILHEFATLGRSPDNQVVLSDTSISAHHARLDRRDGEWWLTDLGSRNGTRLNDVPITRSVPLADGDVIGIGQLELKLEIEN